MAFTSSALLHGLLVLFLAGTGDPGDWFRITVVDAETGRGIPLVELETTNGLRHVTDSAGVVAFNEPGLMEREVWLHVRSHGYAIEADGFGYRGVRLVPRAGGSARIEMQRVNLAERLYRVTGQGIYADSRRLGDAVPLHDPLLDGAVMGQDSVLSTIYDGRIFWVWGDTSRPSYPLGNFEAAGAWSALPRRGGLEPAVGVNLDYLVGKDGFSRPIAPIEGSGPVWLDALVVLGDLDDRERMYARFVRVERLGRLHEQGWLEWNDDVGRFEPVARWSLDEPVVPAGHPFRVEAEDGEDWVHFTKPYPSVRVRATADALRDPDRAEAFTCLRTGTLYRHDDADTPLPPADAIDRWEDGSIRWAWRRGTSTVPPLAARRLVEAERLAEDEVWSRLLDVESGNSVLNHGGSTYWNPYRRRWISIVLESYGEPSFLGEIWYAEGDTPLGPWTWARRIVTHDGYSFYNPKQHRFFDQDGGRTIYFEGTYTKMFSRTEVPTPRYDYNQIMYRLRLDDPRLALPVPIYRLDSDGRPSFALGPEVRRSNGWARVVDAPFCAWDPEGPVPPEAVPVFVNREGRLVREGEEPVGDPLFFGRSVTADSEDAEDPGGVVRPLLEYRASTRGRYRYRVEDGRPIESDWRRTDRAPFVAVWPMPAAPGVVRSVLDARLE